MNTDAINLGRSLFFGGGGGASVRYGTVRSVNSGRATVDVDGGLVEAPAMTCVPADAAGKRCVVLAEGASATVLGVLGEAPEAAPDLTDRVDVLEGSVAALEAGLRPVSTGTSGIWTYVIWSDGTAECWGRKEQTVTFSNAFGSVYFVMSGADLPFTFASTPCVELSVYSSGGGIYGASANDVGTTSVPYFLYSFSAEPNKTLVTNIYVRGTKA